MADRGRNDDRILRWVLKTAYGLRNPSADQLRNYQHWHAVSRRDGFAGFEPPDWRDWPWKLIPPGDTPLVITHPEPASPPETICSDCEQMRGKTRSSAESMSFCAMAHACSTRAHSSSSWPPASPPQWCKTPGVGSQYLFAVTDANVGWRQRGCD
jgi:hypothetical protein